MIIITGASHNIGKYLFEKYSEKENVIGTFFNTKPGPKTKRGQTLSGGCFRL